MTFKQAKAQVELERAVYLQSKYAAKGDSFWVEQMQIQINALEMVLSN